MKKPVVVLCIVFALSACATPEVNRRAATFDEADFATDLALCQGGNIIVATAKTVGLTILGSMYGAAEGALYGVKNADTAEAAAIGAVVGGTIGLTAGGLSAVENQEAEIAACLSKKGYQVADTAMIEINPQDFSRQRLRHR